MPELEDELFASLMSLRDAEPGCANHMFVFPNRLATALHDLDPQKAPRLVEKDVTLLLRAAA